MLSYPIDKENKLFDLPSYIEMKQRITDKFSSIYSLPIDIFLGSFTRTELIPFHCKLDQNDFVKALGQNVFFLGKTRSKYNF